MKYSYVHNEITKSDKGYLMIINKRLSDGKHKRLTHTIDTTYEHVKQHPVFIYASVWLL